MDALQSLQGTALWALSKPALHKSHQGACIKSPYLCCGWCLNLHCRCSNIVLAQTQLCSFSAWIHTSKEPRWWGRQGSRMIKLGLTLPLSVRTCFPLFLLYFTAPFPTS